MKPQYLLATFAAVMAFGPPLMAQSSTPPILTYPYPFFQQQTFTTGIVGFTLNQTARLNVLNLNSIPATNAVLPNCTVELQFFDDKNNLVKQTLIPNFAPGTATFLDLTRAAVTSPAVSRAQIRGVVVVNPPTPLASPVAVGYCSVMTTLEIFDAVTGSTVALTSDTRAIGMGFVMAPGPMPPPR